MKVEANPLLPAAAVSPWGRVCYSGLDCSFTAWALHGKDPWSEGWVEPQIPPATVPLHAQDSACPPLRLKWGLLLQL